MLLLNIKFLKDICVVLGVVISFTCCTSVTSVHTEAFCASMLMLLLNIKFLNNTCVVVGIVCCASVTRSHTEVFCACI